MGHAPVVYVSNPGGRTLRPTFGWGNTGKEGGDCCSLAKQVGDHVNELVIASHAITDTHVLAISCACRKPIGRPLALSRSSEARAVRGAWGGRAKRRVKPYYCVYASVRVAVPFAVGCTACGRQGIVDP